MASPRCFVPIALAAGMMLGCPTRQEHSKATAEPQGVPAPGANADDGGDAPPNRPTVPDPQPPETPESDGPPWP